MPGLFLFIEGNIVRKSWGEQNLEFKIRSVDLLNELATKKVNGLALRFDVQAVTSQFIDSIDKLCKKNAGSAALRMYLKDEGASLQAEVLSRSARIKPTNLLINELKRLADVGVVTDKQEVRWLTEQPLKLSQKTEVGTTSPDFVLEEVEV
jgi:DNA polymerase-3 subunit alpha